MNPILFYTLLSLAITLLAVVIRIRGVRVERKAVLKAREKDSSYKSNMTKGGLLRFFIFSVIPGANLIALMVAIMYGAICSMYVYDKQINEFLESVEEKFKWLSNTRKRYSEWKKEPYVN